MSEEKKGSKAALPETGLAQGLAAAPKETMRKKEPKHAVERLRKDCLKLFGVTAGAFDGASCGLTGSYTVAEMQKIISDWRNKPVANEKRKDGR